MSVRNIVTYFDALGKIPVSISEVLNQVSKFAGDEKIRIKGIDQPFDELKAMIYRYKIEDGTTYMVPIMCSEIIYSTRMSLGWQRLACCKEMLHILDPNPVWKSKAEEVILLAEKLVNQKSESVDSGNGLQALADHLGKWQAVAVLYPHGLWEKVRSDMPHNDETCEKVAEWLQLPSEIIHVTMSEVWEVLRPAILAYA